MKAPIGKLFLPAALALAVWSSVSAQDVELDRIVITASRVEEDSSGVARNVDVVTRRDIERSQAQDLSGLLTDFTSVNVSDYGGLGASKTVRMRGSTSSQVLVLVDGRPINSPRDGQADLSAIPLDNIERVEIVHGPGSSLYGSGPMGGTVNIITRNPPGEKQKTELYSSFGTFRTYTERLSHGARVSGFGYLVTSGYQSSAGFRANTKLEAKDANTKLTYKFNDSNDITLNSGFYRSRLGSPGSIVSPDFDDTQKNTKKFIDASWGFRPDDATAASIKAYQNYDRLEFDENTAGSIFDVAGKKDVHITVVRGYDAQFSRRFSESYQGICGFNYVGNFNDSTSSAKHHYTVRAGYLENKIDLFGSLKLNFGARLDDYSNLGAEINPSFNFLYSAGDALKLRGSISRSFRAPTFNDLYWPDEGWAKGNPLLKPEKGVTKEIGVQVAPHKRFGFGLTYYRSDYDNLINWAEEAGVWQPMNVNSAVIDGIELENKIKIADRWSLDTGYTYLNAKDADTHKYLIYQPRHKADCSLKYRDPRGLACELKGQFTGTRFHDAANTIEVKRFYTVGFNVSKKCKSGITYFAAVDNLLAKKYNVIQDYPMPGFSFTGGLKAEF
ncbi:MAG TPA: TonB-dependent receptor [Patescibacteria group bacterium]|nr:TonB-dependent receptor [Patescibacteria group bacterium]